MTDKIIESANNPANEPKKKELPANWIPLSGGVQKLVVPERTGYKRRWFRGDPGRIARARQAGYSHVDRKDVALNNFDLGGDANASGGTDLGSYVSVISGDDAGPDGQPGRMYLMECPIEFYEASRAFVEERNDGIVEALTSGTLGDAQESAKRYTSVDKNGLPDLFRKKTSRR